MKTLLLEQSSFGSFLQRILLTLPYRPPARRVARLDTARVDLEPWRKCWWQQRPQRSSYDARLQRRPSFRPLVRRRDQHIPAHAYYSETAVGEQLLQAMGGEAMSIGETEQ